MSFLCLGFSYQTAPVAVRERMALSANQRQELLFKVVSGQVAGIDELVILSTCNRTEFYVSGSPETAILLDLWRSVLDMPTAEANAIFSTIVYERPNDACIAHLMRVAAGLDSQVVGEPQILGQVVTAYEEARQLGSAKMQLSALMQAAILAGKRIRAETEVGHGAFSISSVAAAHAQEILGSFDKTCVLIIGAGEMARGAAAAFVRQTVDRLLVVNHNYEHARELAELWGGEVVPYTQLDEALLQADMVVSAVAAPHPILHTEDMAVILPKRTRSPLIIFDIALPRNAEPEIAQLAGVKLFNLDDLQMAQEHHQSVRDAAIPQVEAIIDEEIRAFQTRQAERAAVPLIRTLRTKAEDIRLAELEHLLRRLSPATERDRALIEEFSLRLINKLLHNPITYLKTKSAEGDAEESFEAFADMFDLMV